MPRIAVAESLPVAMLLGTGWQCEVHTRIVHEPNGGVCIMTPSTMDEFKCIMSTDPFIGCAVQALFLTAPLVEELPVSFFAVLADDTTNADGLTSTQLQIDELTNKFADIFVHDDTEVGVFPNLEMEINLTNHLPVKCKPYRVIKPDHIFIRKQIQQWIDKGICRPSNSPYDASVFIFDQPFYETTPRRLVIDFARTINPIMIKAPNPIDNMDGMVHKFAGKHYKSLFDIRRASQFGHSSNECPKNHCCHTRPSHRVSLCSFWIDKCTCTFRTRTRNRIWSFGS